MIGFNPSPTTALFSAATLRPLNAPAAPGQADGAAWLNGLGGTGGPASLRADVAPDQRGLSVQQHAERVLAALVA
jgi:hypothetical protein